MPKETIEDIIERKVTDILAARALDQASAFAVPEISEEVQRRLELLEQRIEGQDDGREQGLMFLLMAKQHSVRGEYSSALKMYSMAKEYFPNNARLEMKIDRLREKLQERMQGKKVEDEKRIKRVELDARTQKSLTLTSRNFQSSGVHDFDDAMQYDTEEYYEASEPLSDAEYETADSCQHKPRPKKHSRRPPAKAAITVFQDACPSGLEQTPRTKQLLAIVNTRDPSQIRRLKGVGAKKAEAIVEALCAGEDDDGLNWTVYSLSQLGRMKGVGAKTVENMRLGLGV